MAHARAALIWSALGVAIAFPLAVAATSPLLVWREPVCIAAGFAGVVAMALVLVQPLLAGGYLPCLPARRGRFYHRVTSAALVVANAIHVGGLWVTGPPDVVDALLLVSPTPFSTWGVAAIWAALAAALLAVLRRPLRLSPASGAHGPRFGDRDGKRRPRHADRGDEGYCLEGRALHSDGGGDGEGGGGPAGLNGASAAEGLRAQVRKAAPEGAERTRRIFWGGGARPIVHGACSAMPLLACPQRLPRPRHPLRGSAGRGGSARKEANLRPDVLPAREGFEWPGQTRRVRLRKRRRRRVDMENAALPKIFSRSCVALTAAGLALPAAAQDAPLSVAMHYTQEQAAPLIACLDAYDADGVTAAYQQISYGDYLQTVLTGRLAGQSPDIYNVYSIWAPQMVDNGVLAAPPVGISEFVREGWAQSTVDAASIDGTLYGVPTEVSVYMLVSNMALLREAGYDAPPATWEELREMAEAVTTRNDQGRIETAGFAYAQSSSGAGLVHPFYAMIFSEGGDVYGADKSEALLDAPEAQAALQKQAGLVRDGLVDLSVDAYDFPAGGIAMMVMANWYESAIREGLGDGFEDVTVSVIPAGEDWRTLQYAFFMGVDSGSDRQDEAWALVRHLNEARDGGPSCMGEMLDGLGALTANTADTEALPAADAFTQPFADALAENRAISQPNVMQASEIEGLMARAIEEVMAGEAEPAARLEALDAEVEDILAEFY
jgi:multiple sugar transport system substrate-binding protein